MTIVTMDGMRGPDNNVDQETTRTVRTIGQAGNQGDVTEINVEKRKEYITRTCTPIDLP